MQPKKILVVDDSKLMHKMYEVMLRQYTLVRAMEGREALECLDRDPDIDLIFLDINMPVMNGLEFLESVKEDPTKAEIPVVIISTEGKEEDTQRGLEAGAVAYIKKPFQNEQILNIIAQVKKGSAA